MSDVYTPDPDRLIIGSPIGHVQAWGASAAEPSVSVSFYAGMLHTPSEAPAYISQSINLSASDARELAAALITAANHADRVCTDKPVEVAA